MDNKDDKTAYDDGMAPEDLVAWIQLKQDMDAMLKALDALENRVEIVFVMGNDTKH